MSLCDSATVEANEDIVSAQGLKLLSKGARIDRRVQERLLDHKLRRPLEMSLRVVDGVDSRPIDRLAESLLDRHPLLSRLAGSAASRRELALALRQVPMSGEVNALLSVYAGVNESQLEHAVGIALLTAALANAAEVNAPRAPELLLAGLLHDVGELYVDPQLMRPGVELSPKQWRHVAVHPIVGARVLEAMPGAGRKVASLVLQHHQRQDGGGYPPRASARGGQPPAALERPVQCLSAAEMLLGLLAAAGPVDLRVAVAARMVPGEFDPILVDCLVRAAGGCAPEGRPQATPEIEVVMSQASGLFQRLRVLTARARVLEAEPGASAGLKDLASRANERAMRLLTALTCTGLGDAADPSGLLDALTQPGLRAELDSALREVSWRLREMVRLLHLQRDGLNLADTVRLDDWLNAVAATDKGKPTS